MNIDGVVKLKDFADLKQLENSLTGLGSFDSLTGGLIKGGVSEIFGREGSGKRSLIISLLAHLTGQNLICAIVDTSNSFDPVSAEKNGVNLNKILWIKCDDDPKQAIIATDYLIQSSFFGAIWLDLSLCDREFLERMPNSYWFRFKVGLKETPASLIVTLKESKLRSAAHQSIRVTKIEQKWSGKYNFKVPSESVVKLELLRPTLNDGYISIISDHL